MVGANVPVAIATYDDGSYRTNDCLVSPVFAELRVNLEPDPMRQPVVDGATSAPPNPVERFPLVSIAVVVGFASPALVAWRRSRRFGVGERDVSGVRESWSS